MGKAIIRRSNLKYDWVDIYTDWEIEILILKAIDLHLLSDILWASLNLNSGSNLNYINYYLLY